MLNLNLNKYFQSCVNCVAPKRHPGCHATCEEYAADKAAFEKVKESMKKEQDIAVLFKEGFVRTCRYHGIERREPMR